MNCPKCGSNRITRCSNNGLDCEECKYMGRAQDFGAKCNCGEPHHLPVWYCPVHGDVNVPID